MFKSFKINTGRLRTSCFCACFLVCALLYPHPGQCTTTRLFDIRLTASRRLPTKQADHGWGSFDAYGISIGLPTPSPQLTTRFSLDAGKMSRTSKPYQSHGIVHGAIVFHLMPPWFEQKALSICPFAGLSNMLVFPWDQKPVISTEVFSPSENEFGLVAGMEPVWRYNKYIIALPVQIDHIFSHPKTFATIGVGLHVGRAF